MAGGKESGGAVRRSFSVPAYIGAVAAGDVVMSTLFVAIASPAVAPADEVKAALLAAVGLFMPALLLCLPMTLLGYWLANRFGLRSRLSFVLLGTQASVVTVAAVISLEIAAEPVTSLRILALAALSGAIAGYLYHRLDALEHRSRRGA